MKAILFLSEAMKNRLFEQKATVLSYEVIKALAILFMYNSTNL